ncbi:MAG TPA: type II toxin-antitoxin system PemK/MazF family toxin [Actinomycetaceae bacterium]|nr:type II toxin-antitoxin system PemK/MazF family toxin [Actinomycetaceae bacterium]
MSPSFKSLLQRAGREAVRAVEKAIRTTTTTARSRTTAPRRASHSTTTTARPSSRDTRQIEKQSGYGQASSAGYAHGGEPSPYGRASARELNVAALPQFDYAPHKDGDADPGEVAWTWVPYEDIPEVGKDRPVLVLAYLGRDLVVLQMTSQDNTRDRAEEARHGRYWMDIGSGNWDSRGRPSEARIDRLLVVGQEAIRREGGVLDERIFNRVVAAVKEAHALGL